MFVNGYKRDKVLFRGSRRPCNSTKTGDFAITVAGQLILAVTALFEVGHASACRRAEARHLRVDGTGRPALPPAASGFVESMLETRASSARLDKLKHIP